MENKKICTKCKIEKPFSEYHKNKSKTGKTYLNSWCKTCKNQKKHKSKEITCFRCGKKEIVYSAEKYCSKECRYEAQSDRMQFENELGLSRIAVGHHSIIN